MSLRSSVCLGMILIIGPGSCLVAKTVIKVSNDEVMAMPQVKSLLKLSGHRSQPTKKDIDELIAGPIAENILAVAYGKMKKLDETDRYKQAITHCKPRDKKLPLGIPCENAWYGLGFLAYEAGVYDAEKKALQALSDEDMKRMYDAAPKSPNEAAIIEFSGLQRRQKSVVRDVLKEQLMKKMFDDARSSYDVQFQPDLSDALLGIILGRQSKQEQKWLADKKRMEELDKE